MMCDEIHRNGFLRLSSLVGLVFFCCIFIYGKDIQRFDLNGVLVLRRYYKPQVERYYMSWLNDDDNESGLYYDTFYLNHSELLSKDSDLIPFPGSLVNEVDLIFPDIKESRALGLDKLDNMKFCYWKLHNTPIIMESAFKLAPYIMASNDDYLYKIVSFDLGIVRYTPFSPEEKRLSASLFDWRENNELNLVYEITGYDCLIGYESGLSSRLWYPASPPQRINIIDSNEFHGLYIVGYKREEREKDSKLLFPRKMVTYDFIDFDTWTYLFYVKDINEANNIFSDILRGKKWNDVNYTLVFPDRYVFIDMFHHMGIPLDKNRIARNRRMVNIGISFSPYYLSDDGTMLYKVLFFSGSCISKKLNRDKSKRDEWEKLFINDYRCDGCDSVSIISEINYFNPFIGLGVAHDIWQPYTDRQNIIIPHTN